MEFDVVKNRRENFARLALRYPSQVAFAQALGRTPQQIGGMLKGSRSFGQKIAREIEKRLVLPPGCLDSPDWGDDPPLVSDGSANTSNKLTIPVLDIEKMDGDIVASKQTTLVKQLKVDHDWLYSQAVALSSPKALRFLSASTDTMAPTIKRGDIVFVDTNQRRLIHDGVYALQLGATLSFRRLQTEPDGILVICDNPNYRSFKVKSEDELSIIGECIMVFNIQVL